MNESGKKNIKTIVIIALSVLLAVSIGFNIFFISRKPGKQIARHEQRIEQFQGQKPENGQAPGFRQLATRM